MPLGNELFQIVNNWLGWGDPRQGLWFIGMEEGVTFSKEVASRKGKEFDLVKDGEDLNWNIANTTAKIVSKLLGVSRYAEYRDSTMWREGSQVFNGNLLPLGKPKRRDWPFHYKELFGFSYDEYSGYLDSVKKYRYKKFREFRKNNSPQAIVCFGKKFWGEFEKLFINDPEDKVFHDEYGLIVFDTDRVILTGHFSYGRWMPNKSVDFVANKLSEWGLN